MHKFFGALSRLATRRFTFTYADANVEALEKAISASRLARYQAAFAGDRLKALECHYWNTRLSQLLYFPIQMYEIILRNALDRQLSRGFGSNWLCEQPEWLHDRDGTVHSPRRDIEKAIATLNRTRKSVTHSSIVAQLGLHFWTELLNSNYHDTLWTLHLRYSFPNYTGSRQNLYRSSKSIRGLRNKISHCDQVLFSCNEHLCSSTQMKEKYNNILQAIRWMSLPAYDWVKDNALFEGAAKEFIKLYHASHSTRAEEAYVTRFEVSENYGFVRFLSDSENAILYRNVVDKDHLAAVQMDHIVNCEASLTTRGWRVTRVLSCRPPYSGCGKGKVLRWVQEGYAFAEVDGETREVLVPARVINKAGLDALRQSTYLSVRYIEAPNGLIAKEVKPVVYEESE